MSTVYLALRRSKNTDSLASRLFGLLVRVRLVTQYPHGGIVVDGELMHATFDKGLHSVPFVGGSWELFEVPSITASVVRSRFNALKGAEYDAVSLLAFLLPWRVRDSKRLYCFEWCWLAVTGQNPSGRVTPEKLLNLALTTKGQKCST